MPGQGARLAAPLCCIALGACGEQATQAPPAQSATASTTGGAVSDGLTTRARIHPSLPEFVFTLVGDTAVGPSDIIRVQRIEIRRGSVAEPDQVIGGLNTETPISAGRSTLEVVDMNFDGYEDIRLVEFRSAGPNTVHLHWLFEPSSGKFVETPELNDIPSAQFDAARREIRSDWRAGATHYGSDIYVFSAGRPVLVRKEEKTYQAPGVYALKVMRLVGGIWQTVEQRQVKEPQSLPDGESPHRPR
jgi:hypothetical protein